MSSSINFGEFGRITPAQKRAIETIGEAYLPDTPHFRNVFNIRTQTLNSLLIRGIVIRKRWDAIDKWAWHLTPAAYEPYQHLTGARRQRR